MTAIVPAAGHSSNPGLLANTEQEYYSRQWGGHRRIPVDNPPAASTKNGQPESKDLINRRIEEATNYADLDRPCLSPPRLRVDRGRQYAR